MDFTMPSDGLLSRGDITALTGVPNDVLTFWVRAGLVRPANADAGPRKHLRFPFYEANFAALALGLRDYGLNIEALLSIASIYREAIAWGEANNLDYEQAATMARYLSAVYEITLSIEPGDRLSPDQILERVAYMRDGIDGRFKLTDELINLASKLGKNTDYPLTYAEIICQPVNDAVPHTTYLWKTPSGWKRSIHKLLPMADDAFIQISLNAAGIFYRVWNKA